MSPKFIILIFAFVFSTIGGYIPTLWGADFFSLSSIIGNGIGGLLGVYLGYKIISYY